MTTTNRDGYHDRYNFRQNRRRRFALNNESKSNSDQNSVISVVEPVFRWEEATSSHLPDDFSYRPHSLVAPAPAPVSASASASASASTSASASSSSRSPVSPTVVPSIRAESKGLRDNKMQFHRPRQNVTYVPPESQRPMDPPPSRHARATESLLDVEEGTNAMVGMEQEILLSPYLNGDSSSSSIAGSSLTGTVSRAAGGSAPVEDYDDDDDDDDEAFGGEYYHDEWNTHYANEDSPSIQYRPPSGRHKSKKRQSSPLGCICCLLFALLVLGVVVFLIGWFGYGRFGLDSHNDMNTAAASAANPSSPSEPATSSTLSLPTKRPAASPSTPSQAKTPATPGPSPSILATASTRNPKLTQGPSPASTSLTPLLSSMPTSVGPTSLKPEPVLTTSRPTVDATSPRSLAPRPTIPPLTTGPTSAPSTPATTTMPSTSPTISFSTVMSSLLSKTTPPPPTASPTALSTTTDPTTTRRMTLRNIRFRVSDQFDAFGTETLRPEIRFGHDVFYPWYPNDQSEYPYHVVEHGAWFPLKQFDDWCHPTDGCQGHSLVSGPLELRISLQMDENSIVDYVWTFQPDAWFQPLSNYEPESVDTTNGKYVKWKFDVVQV